MFPIELSRDVLAIRCIEDHVILGIGNQLRLFGLLNFELITTIDTDHQDAIHDIIRSSNKLIVFGGRHLSIFKFEIKSEEITVEEECHHTFNDWIIGAEFFTPNSENIYILFAHNNLYLFNTLTGIFRNIWCEERCILYGGYLSRENTEEVVIFSCTVFQEILLWKVDNKFEYQSDIRVLHRLRGHRGIIFSVFYEPKLKLITSTSDDRTIRLWKIVQKNHMLSHSIEWENIEINLITTMFGHTARIWKSIIVNNSMISIGEDSLICLWSLSGDLCSKICGHGGAPIWSIEISTDKSTVITGGGDGAVNTWSLDSLKNPTLVPKFIYQEKSPKFLGFLNSGALAVFIDGGHLLIYDVTDELTYSFHLPKYGNYCLMHISPNRQNIAFTSQDGYICIFREYPDKQLHRIVEKKIINSKIFSFQWLNDKKILICGAQGQLKILNLEDNEIRVVSEFILPPSKECWTTSAMIFRSLLICGDRAGSIYVFQIHPTLSKGPKQIFSKVHGKLGVQSFGLLGKKLISTGRDGTMRFYQIILVNCEESLRPLHWKKMPMEWVSKTLESGNDFYVVGFKEIEFMIFSMRLNRLLLRVICGGGHRSWDCALKNQVINFACIKNKQVHILNNMPCGSCKTLIPGFHTKAIHSLKILHTFENHKLILSGSEDCSIRISLSDPTSILKKYHLRPLDVYAGHISNVKAIEILNLNCSEGNSKNLIFSGGGRAQLKVWEINIDSNKEMIQSDDIMTVELTSFMLRGTDKERRKKPQNNGELYILNPETRFMDLSVHYLRPLDKNYVILFVACSDGFIRVLSYNIEVNALLLIGSIPYLNRCIMKVHSFLHDRDLILISMATDGFINLWNMKFLLENNEEEFPDGITPFGKWKAHHSGINCYDWKAKENNEYFIVTGGDDNKINLSSFKIFNFSSDDTILKLESNWETSSVHSGQITGVKFLMDDQLLSVGMDQRLILYEYSFIEGELCVVPKKIIQTFVSDVQGLTLSHKDENGMKTYAYVYGQGLEMLSQENER